MLHVLLLVLPTFGPSIVKVSLVVGVRLNLVALFLVKLSEVETCVGLALIIGVVLCQPQVFG